MEQSVTAVLEQQLNGLEGVESITSSSRQGGASVSLRFSEGDPELNAIKVQNEVNLATRRLPQSVSRQGLQVSRSSDDLLMILGFSHEQGLYASTYLRGWIDQSVRDALLTIPGVGRVFIFGGDELAFRLWLDADLLEQANLTINNVTQALAEQNVLAAIGNLGASPAPEGQLVSLPVDAEGRLRSVKDLENLSSGPWRMEGRCACGTSAELSWARAAMAARPSTCRVSNQWVLASTNGTAPQPSRSAGA